MKNSIASKDVLVNEVAIYILFEYGGRRLKNVEFYRKLLQKIEESKPNPIITTQQKIEALRIARKIAYSSQIDTYNFLKNEIIYFKNDNKVGA